MLLFWSRQPANRTDFTLTIPLHLFILAKINRKARQNCSRSVAPVDINVALALEPFGHLGISPRQLDPVRARAEGIAGKVVEIWALGRHWEDSAGGMAVSLKEE